MRRTLSRNHALEACDLALDAQVGFVGKGALLNLFDVIATGIGLKPPEKKTEAPASPSASATSTSQVNAKVDTKLDAARETPRPTVASAALATAKSAEAKQDAPKAVTAPSTSAERHESSKQQSSPPPSTAPKTAPAGTAAGRTAEQVAKDAKQAPPKATGNDGKAVTIVEGAKDPAKDKTKNGTADQQIKSLGEEKARIENEQKDITVKVAALEGVIDTKEKVSTNVGMVTELITSPLDLIGGFLTGNMPKALVKTAVEGATDGVGKHATEIISNVAKDKDELVARKRDNEARLAEIDRTKQQLVLEQNRNFLSDVAHVTGGSEAMWSAIDGQGGIKMEVVKQTDTNGAAEFDHGTNTIQISQSTNDQITKERQALLDKGIVDGDGNVVQGREHDLDASTEGDAAIGHAVLVGVHEVAHAAQKERATTGAPNAADAPTADADELTLEHEAYLAGERMQMQLGGTKKGFVTIDEKGTALPTDQARANIEAFEAGEPIVFGPSAGKLLEAGSVQATPGEDAGRNSPGRNGPGRNSPGRNGPGRNSPGRNSPGRNSPGIADLGVGYTTVTPPASALTQALQGTNTGSTTTK